MVKAAGAVLNLDLGVDELRLAGVAVSGMSSLPCEIAVFDCRFSVIAFEAVLL